MSEPVITLLCARCTRELRPGTGDFFQVMIEAIADPSPPLLDENKSAAQLRHEIEALLRQLEGVSAQEAMDQIHRKLTIHLCNGCFRRWIENPTG